VKAGESPALRFYTYDGVGRMIWARRGTTGTPAGVSSTDFAYDDLSRPTGETQELFGDAGSAKTLAYDYDQAGRVAGIAWVAWAGVACPWFVR